MRGAIFVYIKNGEYRCLDIMDVSMAVEVDLKRSGWKHSATIRPDLWLETYLNGTETERFNQIEDISK